MANGGTGVAHERALARNEALFREVNERIAEITEANDAANGDPIAFVCECSSLDCGGNVRLTLDEYVALRESPRVFAVVPGHERLEVERVVGEGRDYLLVEKLGEAGEVAEETAPE